MASPRRVQGGEPSNELVFSSWRGDNAEVFAAILDLFVPKGSRVADVTWGKGAFWKKVNVADYELLPSDLKTGTDFRDLPYEDESIDALVLDPPYMEGLLRSSETHLAGSGTHSAFREHYSDGKPIVAGEGEPKYHDAVLKLYFDGGKEALRVLKKYGIFIVKCQDEVSANRQRLTHVELINGWADHFYCKDLFVVTRTNKPVISRLKKQEHARKNHSYFLVLMKKDPIYPNRTKPPKSR